MEQWMENSTRHVLEWWQTATPVHYVQLMLAVILVGWYVRRFRAE